jgi:hypothetical protein
MEKEKGQRVDGHISDVVVAGNGERKYAEVVSFMLDGPVSLHDAFPEYGLNTTTAIMEIPYSVDDDDKLNKRLKNLNPSFFYNSKNRTVLQDRYKSNVGVVDISSTTGVVGLYSSLQREDGGLWLNRYFVVAKDCIPSLSFAMYETIKKYNDENELIFVNNKILASDFICKTRRFLDLPSTVQRDIQNKVITWNKFLHSEEFDNWKIQQMEHVLTLINQFIKEIFPLQATKNNTTIQIENRFVKSDKCVFFIRNSPYIENQKTYLIVRENPLSGFTVYLDIKKESRIDSHALKRCHSTSSVSSGILSPYMKHNYFGSKYSPPLKKHTNTSGEWDALRKNTDRNYSEDNGALFDELANNLEVSKLTKLKGRPPIKFNKEGNVIKVPRIISHTFTKASVISTGETDKHIEDYMKTLHSIRSSKMLSCSVYPTELFNNDLLDKKIDMVNVANVEQLLKVIEDNVPGIIIDGSNETGKDYIMYSMKDCFFIMRKSFLTLYTFFNPCLWGTVFDMRHDIADKYITENRAHTKLILKPCVVLYGNS